MVETEATEVACVRCGVQIARSQAVWTSVRFTPEGPAEESDPVCGSACRGHVVLSELQREQCPGYQCKERLEPAPGPGRPREYHSDACRKETNKVLARALKRLAQGRNGEYASGGPRARLERLERLYDEQHFLQRVWQGRPAEIIDGRRYPKPLFPPEGPMAAELGLQVQRLIVLIDLAKKDVHAEETADRYLAEEKRERDAQRARQRVLDGWRERIGENLVEATAKELVQEVEQELQEASADQGGAEGWREGWSK